MSGTLRTGDLNSDPTMLCFCRELLQCQQPLSTCGHTGGRRIREDIRVPSEE